jgi:hypothetical protein
MLSHCNGYQWYFNTYGLTDLQRFIPKFISEITATFPLAQVGMPSAAFEQELMEMTFTQDTIHE